MNSAATTAGPGYSAVAILLHWITAALVVTTLPLGWYGAEYETAAGQSAIGYHKSIGILILGLTLVRVWWRLTHRPPPLPPTVAPLLRGISWTAHTLFYVLLIVLPLSGWWMSSAVADPQSFGFGLFDVPLLPVPQGGASAGTAHFIHTNLAWAMIWLTGLHVLAALNHLLMDDDGTVMARMISSSD